MSNLIFDKEQEERDESASDSLALALVLLPAFLGLVGLLLIAGAVS